MAQSKLFIMPERPSVRTASPLRQSAASIQAVTPCGCGSDGKP